MTLRFVTFAQYLVLFASLIALTTSDQWNAPYADASRTNFRYVEGLKPCGKWDIGVGNGSLIPPAVDSKGNIIMMVQDTNNVNYLTSYNGVDGSQNYRITFNLVADIKYMAIDSSDTIYVPVWYHGNQLQMYKLSASSGSIVSSTVIKQKTNFAAGPTLSTNGEHIYLLIDGNFSAFDTSSMSLVYTFEIPLWTKPTFSGSEWDPLVCMETACFGVLYQGEQFTLHGFDLVNKRVSWTKTNDQVNSYSVAWNPISNNLIVAIDFEQILSVNVKGVEQWRTPKPQLCSNPHVAVNPETGNFFVLCDGTNSYNAYTSSGKLIYQTKYPSDRTGTNYPGAVQYKGAGSPFATYSMVNGPYSSILAGVYQNGKLAFNETYPASIPFSIRGVAQVNQNSYMTSIFQYDDSPFGDLVQVILHCVSHS